MALLTRPLWRWQRLHSCSSLAPFDYHCRHLSSSLFLLLPSEAHSIRQLLAATTVASAHRNFHYRLGGLRFLNARTSTNGPYEFRQGEVTDSDSDAPKSRNQKKREARQAVRWAMDLASFSTAQIKRILRMASLEQEPEVFEGLMIVKRLGPDVKEGKRRQFNYIGKLLREAEPELMDTLIQATKDGDESRLQALSAAGASADGFDEDISEVEFEEEEEECDEYVSIATRWCNGLVSRDIDITNEVYSLRSIDFDRQELRRLVRGVHLVQEQKPDTDSDNEEEEEEEEEEEDGPELARAKKSLTRFLLTLAKQVPSSDI